MSCGKGAITDKFRHTHTTFKKLTSMWASRCISLHLQGLKPYIIFVQGSNVMRSVYNKTIICHSRVIVVTIYANLQSSLNQFQPQICSFFAAEFCVTTLFRVIFPLQF